MPVAIDHNAAGIGIDGRQKCLEGVEEANHENGGPNDFEVLRNEPQPQLFSCTDQDQNREQDADVAA